MDGDVGRQASPTPSNVPAVPPTISTVPAVGLGIALLTSLALLIAGLRMAKRARLARDFGPSVVVCAIIGVAILALTLFASGLWHYGGSISGSDDPSHFRCAAWYEEVGSSQGLSEGDESSPDLYCRHAATDAVAPALAWSVGAGLAASGFAVVFLRARRRRLNADLRELTA